MRTTALFLSLVLSAGFARAEVSPDSISPNKEYGVTVPASEKGFNQLVLVKSGKVLATIQGNFALARMNHQAIEPSRWSTDSSTLLWIVSGKWSPWALTLVHIDNGAVKWQLDILKTAQQETLKRTKAAEPKKYAAAMKENTGNGSAYPDGFTIDVRIEGQETDPIVFPLKVYANLTSNPKEEENYPKKAQLDSQLDGLVSQDGKFAVTKFNLVPSSLAP